MPRNASVVVLGILASAAIAQGIVACSSDDTSSATTAKDGGADSHVVDTGVVNTACSGDLPVMRALDKDAGVEVDPDWSCYLSNDAGFLDLDAGDSAAPDASDAGDAASDAATPDAEAPDAGSTARVFHLIDFLRQDDVSGVSVDFFYSRSAAGNPGFNGTTDAKGVITFTPPTTDIGVFAYRVNAFVSDASGASRHTTIQYDNLTPRAGGTAVGQSITESDLGTLLAGVLGSQAATKGKSLLVGVAQDCQGRDLKGAVLELIDGATQLPVPTGKASGDMRDSYFYSNLPNDQCTYTSSDKAIWAGINAPTNMPGNTHPYSIRMSGRMHDTDVAASIIGEQPIELWPDIASIVRPYRLSPP